ncbi:MAG: hypothetical protein VX733_13320 [Candidatus Latescibacterota bacterium]|nr:hypothetical protein [Candidatus Latescibacterota bacterium]
MGTATYGAMVNSSPVSASEARDSARTRTAVVIPVYFPPDADNALAAELLADNVTSCVAAVDDAGMICLSVDGVDSGVEIADKLASRHGATLVVAEENMGKLHGVRTGAAVMLQREPEFLAVIDADGDHFANELQNLVRAALYVRYQFAAMDCLVLGRRISRHRPMGLLRGELEELADRLLLDALVYHSNVSHRPLRWECATTLEEFPDFHSGYKLFTGAIAEAVFLQKPEFCGVSEAAYYRHGCESVMVVEGLRAGAYFALANRTTLNEQPVSTFGRLDRERLVADKIVWPMRRLGVPVVFVDQWLRNHIPRLLLNTLAPQGKEELVRIRNLIADEMGLPDVEPDQLTSGPLFL